MIRRACWPPSPTPPGTAPTDEFIDHLRGYYKNKHVIIVGAGAAGITAARWLHNRDVKVTILEARDRLGGRIRTDRSLGFPIDTGAHFIHGTLARLIIVQKPRFIRAFFIWLCKQGRMKTH